MADTALFRGATGSRGIHPTSSRLVLGAPGIETSINQTRPTSPVVSKYSLLPQASPSIMLQRMIQMY